MKRLKYLVLLLILIGIDQLTKYWATIQFSDDQSLSLIPKVLRFVYHENDGAAWGMFSGRAFLLSFITLVAVIVFAWVFFRLPTKSHYTPLRILLVFVAAGAIGNNLIDRILFGHVIDFIYFELIDFPVFNVADCYITVSTFVFAILALFYYKEDDFDFFKRKK